MTPYAYGPKFMWNLDCSVGKGAGNNLPADVSFIQWYYTLSADFHLTTSDCRDVYRKVRITGECSGRDGDPLVAAILAQQRAMNHPHADGRVSVVTGTGKLGENAFFLLRLEARFAVMFPDQWPRLDLIPHCPGPVLEVSRAAVPRMTELVR